MDKTIHIKVCVQFEQTGEQICWELTKDNLVIEETWIRIDLSSYAPTLYNGDTITIPIVIT